MTAPDCDVSPPFREDAGMTWGPPGQSKMVVRLKTLTFITSADVRGHSHVLGIRTWMHGGLTQATTHTSAQALVHPQEFIDLLPIVHCTGQREFYTHTRSHTQMHMPVDKHA